jgi:prepilin-type N-terminal cleavage/methylation domain-containing protein
MNRSQRGFSLIELMIVVLITIIITGMAVTSIPRITNNFRISGDTRNISAQLSQARMVAAAQFTHARVYMKLDSNSYRLEVWNKAGDATHTTGCWETYGDIAANLCTQATSPITPLGWGDTFGYGSITSGPTAATTTIAQAPKCTPGVAGASAGTAINNTACIEFNSRSYPVDSTNTLVTSDAIYLGNNSTTYSGIAVSIIGQPTAYGYSGTAWFKY